MLLQGLVNRDSLPRKHMKDQTSQQSHLIQGENGIVGSECKKEFATVTRIDWGHGDHSEEPLIGGKLLDDQYKTVYKAQTLGEGTSREQLSLMKRTMKPIPDKPVEDTKPRRSANHFKENFPAAGPSERSMNGTRSYVADLGDSLVHLTPDLPKVRRKTRN